MKKNEKKKTNKKLLSAFGMFMLSGAMLGTATYAWFTMSREVEVKNIQMTATVPEDTQISLGALESTDENISYAKNTGTIKLISGDVVSWDNIKAPDNGSAGNALYDWSNTVDVTKYYTFGKLIPASSKDGVNIYFTPDSTGVGRTISDSAKSYAASSGTTANADDGSGTYRVNAVLSSGTTDQATPWSGYTTATGWNVTNDDGYYMDIPVWLRTSSTSGATLTVQALVSLGPKTQNSGSDNDDLYLATRVAIIDPGSQTGSGTVANKGVIDVGSGSTYGSGSVVDTDNYNTRYSTTGLWAIDGTGDLSSGSYANMTVNKATSSDVVITLAPGTGVEYGDATKAIIRVWIDGEDINCWNPNAGQDFNLSLKFTNTATTTH